MTAHFDIKNYKYRLSVTDRIKLGFAEFRLVAHTDAGYMIVPIDGGPPSLLEHGRFNEGLRTGYVEVRRGDGCDPAAVAATTDKLVSQLPAGTIAAANRRLKWVMALQDEFRRREVVGEAPLKLTRALVKNMLPAIKIRMAEAVEAEDTTHRRKYAAGDLRIPKPPSEKALKLWHDKWVLQGFKGLLDSRHLRGNRKPRMTREESALMNRKVHDYLSPQQPSRQGIIREVEQAFKKENIERRLDGRPELRKPSRQTIRRTLDRLSPFQCDLQRLGLDAAIRKWAPHSRGLELTRPLQRVEIDEWTVDLIGFMSKYGLDPLLSDEELAELGLDGSKDRWTISVAVDCATRCVLALRMTRNPSEACAIATVDMITRDKGEFANAVGAQCSWHHHGTPEHVVTDGGPAYTSDRFNAMLADLGITTERGPGAVPMARGTVERLFGTFALKLMPLLSGRTFSDVVRRGDHPSEARAALTADDLIFALLRWAIDVYHNEIHEGIGCTPNEKWAELYATWHSPPPPSVHRRRTAFGARAVRKIDKGGIEILGIRYNSETLQEWYRHHAERDVEVCWYHRDLGAIEVKLGKDWFTVPSVFDGFKDLDAQHWIAGVRAQRIRNAKTQAENETIIIEALDAIKAVNAAAMKRADVFDFDWTDKRIERVEQDLFVGFVVSQDPRVPQRDPAEAEDRLMSTTIPVEIEASPPTVTDATATTPADDVSDADGDGDDGWRF